MDSKFILPIGMIVTLTGCENVEHPSKAERSEQANYAFTVPLKYATTKETITSQIVAAGHVQIAAMCEAEPGTSVRVFNPLASGAYEDISCKSVLDGEEDTGEASASMIAHENDGPIGTAQERLSPFTVVCGIIVGSAYLFMSRGLCANPKAENPEACRDVTDVGFFGLGMACGFM